MLHELTCLYWNRSFRTERSGEEEVADFFARACEDLETQLDTTLVALNGQEATETDLDQLVDRIIAVPPENLSNPAAVAEQIGLYVAQRMREWRQLKSDSLTAL